MPGHGPVMRDKSYLMLVTRLVESLVEQVRAGVEKGQSLDEIKSALDIDGYRKRITGDDPRLEIGFERFFLEPVLSSLHLELTGNGSEAPSSPCS